MRAALGIDLDLRPFYERFRDDALIGPSVRAASRAPSARQAGPVRGAGVGGVRAADRVRARGGIQRRLIVAARAALRAQRDARRARPRPRSPHSPRRCCARSASRRPGRSRWCAPPARSPPVAPTSTTPTTSAPGGAWQAIKGIGSWTLQMLAFTGQGRLDQLPAGDLAYLKFVGRLRSGGDPWARATEPEVTELFAPYEPYAGLAGLHALRAGGGLRGRACGVRLRRGEAELEGSHGAARTRRASRPRRRTAPAGDVPRTEPSARALANGQGSSFTVAGGRGRASARGPRSHRRSGTLGRGRGRPSEAQRERHVVPGPDRAGCCARPHQGRRSATPASSSWKSRCSARNARIASASAAGELVQIAARVEPPAVHRDEQRGVPALRDEAPRAGREHRRGAGRSASP